MYRKNIWKGSKEHGTGKKKKKRCGEKSRGIGGREKIKIKDQEKKSDENSMQGEKRMK